MEWLFKITIILFLSLKSVGVQAQSLVVTSLPAILFQTNGGVHNITAGSVIQLYCSVQSTTASFSWTKDGRPVVIDIPHLRERRCNDSTSAQSVLTVDNFQSSDDGAYMCMAMDGNTTGQGGSIEMRAAINGSLSIIRHPTEDEELLEGGLFSEDNRTGIELGSQVSMNCTAETSNDALPIQILWIRNGNTIADDTTHHVNTTNLSSNLRITDFTLSDVGVYQCIFINAENIVTTIPFRLQTDIIFENRSTIFLERVSPEVIFLDPPEKLIIEIKATGRYRNIWWSKNGSPLTVQPQQFSNYNEILVYTTTMQDDLGLYEVSLRAANIFVQQSIPVELDFFVITPVKANTTITTGSDITVREGNSVNILCISIGAPTPSISWELDGQPVPFQSVENVTQGHTTLVRSDPNDQGSPLIPNVVSSMIASDLLVVNAQYPDHDGVYTCIGSNNISMINISSATINVQVIVPPEVELTASDLKVGLGGSITLLCNVTRANPGITGMYIWRNENTGTFLSEQSDNLQVTLSSANDFGTYSCTVTNSAGEVGTGNLTITQGFSPLIALVQHLPEGSVVIGTTIELICTTAGVDPPRTITWIFNGAAIDTESETTSFNISRQISGSDYGVYTCSASNEFGSDSETIEIIQAVAPTLVPITTDVEVEVGMSLTLSVNITGFNLKVTDIVWLNNSGTVVSQTSDIYTITNSSLDAPVGTATLFVEYVTSPVVYGGIYQVTVTNPAGSDSSIFNVSITTPATINSPLLDSSTSVSEYDNITLMCIARGFPAPVIRWNFTNEQNERITVTALVPIYMDFLALFTVESTLTISQSSRHSSGRYSCVATNTIMGSTRIDTINFDVTVNFSATFYDTPMDIAVLIPDAAVLRCQADGEPIPDITWMRELNNGSSVELISEGNVTITEEVNGLNKTSTLTIQSSSIQNSGNYRCRAENELNSVLSGIFHITTYAGPRVTFPVDDDVFVVNVTSDIIVSCTAFGQPPPTIQFYYNGSLLIGNDDSTLSISSPRLIGNEVSRTLILFNASIWAEALTSLQCQATNSITELNLTLESNASYHIIIQVPPSVYPMGGFAEVIANRGEVATLSFTIKDATPPVMTEDIRWIYSPSFSLTPFNDTNQDITNLSTHATGSTFDFSNDQLSLTISNIVQDLQAGDNITDSGRYFLVATNPAGVAFSYTDLIIPSPPVITVPPNQLNIINNSNATFTCVSLRVFPQHHIVWTFSDSNGREIEIIHTQDGGNSSKYSINHESGTTILTIVNATFEDRGTYSCNASNEVGQAEASANLTVQVPPIIEQLSSDTSIVIGADSLILVCLATGYPIPSISWLKNNVSFNIDTDTSLIIEFSNQTRNESLNEVLVHSGFIHNETIQELLHLYTDISINDINQLGDLGVVSFIRFFSVSREDEGSYRCNASNELKVQLRIISQPIWVTIIDAPPIPSSTPSVITMFDPLTRRLIISLPSFDTTNGPISHYQVVVVLLPLSASTVGLDNANTLFPPSKLGSYQESLCRMTTSAVKAYVTAEFAAEQFPRSETFIVGLNSSGDENSPNDRPDIYINGKLCYGTKYSFFIRAFPGSDTSRSRQYITFTSSDYSPEITTNFIVTTESFFQLRIFPVDNCVSWTERNNDQKQGDIRTHVAQVIASACSCGFPATNITESVFSCRSSETQVVFKARLSYTSPAGTQTAEDLVMLFSLWVSSGPSLTVTGTVLSVDPTCPVELRSLTDEDCLRPNPPMVSDALNVTTIWAGTLGGVLAITIMIVIVIIVLMLVRYSRRTKALNISRSYELQPLDKKSAAEGTSPEYEVIPAKNPTVQSNIAYGMIQLPKANNPAVVLSIQQQECESRRGDKQISAMQESIAAANSPQDSGYYVNPSTQADGTNEEESAYDEI